ncbi:MAG: hypothetical protein WC045_00905 [Patescibacteria group bacterium]
MLDDSIVEESVSRDYLEDMKKRYESYLNDYHQNVVLLQSQRDAARKEGVEFIRLLLTISIAIMGLVGFIYPHVLPSRIYFFESGYILLFLQIVFSVFFLRENIDIRANEVARISNEYYDTNEVVNNAWLDGFKSHDFKKLDNIYGGIIAKVQSNDSGIKQKDHGYLSYFKELLVLLFMGGVVTLVFSLRKLSFITTWEYGLVLTLILVICFSDCAIYFDKVISRLVDPIKTRVKYIFSIFNIKE